VLTGSAFKNKGIQPLLDAVIDYLPSPLDVPPIHGIDPRTENELSRRPALDEPFAALAFKVMSDPFVGKLTYIRVYSGQMKQGDKVMNTTTGKSERIGRILQMHANHREERDELGAGEIAAVVGLKATTTGDTLAIDTAPIRLESMTFPEPVISVAVEPKSKADQDKLGAGLQRLSDEDPTFRVRTDDETGQTIISGMGELHLEVIVNRIQNDHKCEVQTGKPKVAYKQRLRRTLETEARLIKQSGGRGQYAVIWVKFEPVATPEGDLEFVDGIKGGSVPREYIPKVENGLREGFGSGGNYGYPFVNVRATLPLARIAEIAGLPRHLSQHPGGFVIASGRMAELAPVYLEFLKQVGGDRLTEHSCAQIACSHAREDTVVQL
jgi:elongation factor G